jgi:hypothetical protein
MTAPRDPEALLEAAQLFVEIDAHDYAHLGRDAYQAWLDEWQARATNLKRTVQAWS